MSNSIHKQLLVGCVEISVGQSRFAAQKKPLRQMGPEISEQISFSAILDLSEQPNALIQSGLYTKRQILTGKRPLGRRSLSDSQSLNSGHLATLRYLSDFIEFFGDFA